ncbi:response regulator transcription factor [Chitinophaga sedimenti]|uniref:response regulator n=1 Tax=Chitinophaga sedimenti TaxID=2033606 RepID=UPI002002FEC7|nr:response regulator transcription factor [Chitinophaga sedimenti]MCK7555328.1 response regulator transcription factor [Chitinophaga sedimenti]
MMPVRIFLADDHPIVIDGLRLRLGEVPGLEIVFAGTSGLALMETLQHTQPDLVLMDIQLQDVSGVELCRNIVKQFPQVKVMVLTSLDDAHYVRQLIRNGASGYLLKNTDHKTILEAIYKVMDGKQFLDEQIQQKLLHEAITGQRTSRYEIPLTNREKDVLRLIAAEYNNHEIAEELYISLRTVEAHRFNIVQKLGVKNTAGLVKEALKRGLIK